MARRFQSYIFISFGRNACLYTLRCMAEHHSGGEVINGHFTGSVGMRDHHVKTLGSDLNESIEKAKEYALKYGIELKLEESLIGGNLNTITRKPKKYGYTNFTFGKYKDKTYEEIAKTDPKYLNWMLDNLYGVKTKLKPYIKEALDKAQEIK